ncbi:hypothetical protein GVX82_02585 [Patescibacteria group bacterium]|jgi:hypothetical protein|nr:hypothetical protein [Patescibacteria group bacterium]
MRFSPSSLSLTTLAARVRQTRLMAPTRDWLLLLLLAFLGAAGALVFALGEFFAVQAQRVGEAGDDQERTLAIEGELADTLARFAERAERYEALKARYGEATPPEEAEVAAEEDEPTTPEERALVGEEPDVEEPDAPEDIDLAP